MGHDGQEHLKFTIFALGDQKGVLVNYEKFGTLSMYQV